MRKNRSRSVLAVLTAALILTGCAGPAGPADAEPTPAPSAEPSASPVQERSYTTDELAAALPTAENLGDVQGEQNRCPGGEGCDFEPPVVAAASVMYQLDPAASLPPAEAERATNDAWLRPVLSLSARSFDSTAAASDTYGNWQKGRTPESGVIDQPAVSYEGGGYQAGERGEGAVTDFELSGWAGAIDVRRFRLVDLNGATSGEVIAVEAAVLSGKTYVSVYTSMPAAGRSLDELESRTRQVLQQVVDALG